MTRDAAPTSHWASLAELGSERGLRFLFWTYRRLGPWPFRAALLPVVGYFLLFAPSRRRASEEYLRRCVGAAGWGRVARHFWSFAEAVVDKLAVWDGGLALEDVRAEGREAVAAHLAAGRGVLFVGSHLGNLEVARVVSHLRPGLKVHVLVHTAHAERFNRLLLRLDPRASVRLVQVEGFGPAEAAALAECVAQGDSVLVAGDRRPLGEGRTVSAEFLGASAPFAQGPWVLGAALGCPVFLMFCLKEGRTWRLIYEPFAERLELPRARRQEAVAEAARRYASRLEARARETPYQWFNFFPFWAP